MKKVVCVQELTGEARGLAEFASSGFGQEVCMVGGRTHGLRRWHSRDGDIEVGGWRPWVQCDRGGVVGDHRVKCGSWDESRAQWAGDLEFDIVEVGLPAQSSAPGNHMEHGSWDESRVQ